MLDTISLKKSTLQTRANTAIWLGLVTIMAFFAGSGIISYLNTKTLREDSKLVAHTHEVLQSLNSILSSMKDAETGQRGYVLTGQESYLEPYTAAVSRIDRDIISVQELTQDNPNQQPRIERVKIYVQNKLTELEQTIAIRRTKGFEAALQLVETNRGKAAMDRLRQQLEEMQLEERKLRSERIATMDKTYGVAVVSGVLSAVLGLLLAISVAWLMRRAIISREKQNWLQKGETGLSIAMLGDQRIEKLGESILKFLAEYFDAHAGAFFIKEVGGFRRISTYGVPNDSDTPERFTIGDGLLGQAAKDQHAFIVHDVPDGYLKVGSALGKNNPRHLMISPAIMDGETNAVLELGFIHALDGASIELLKSVSESIGLAVKSANYRAELQNLLEETQRQAEELQSQSEELRVSNEELEEQSRALKESQSRLEQQQAELEQTNAQLEEQTQQLEIQRDDLARVGSAVQLKAQELELASQYKSDFLANMSHELRTPLNSSLILAKLLADNTDGNLSDEQVKYAQTIQSSGNDLLALINDILDLSKIEAGHMEINPEQIRLARIIDNQTRLFKPIANSKYVVFETHISPDCPESIETDKQRLEQILKNLLSNAFKFTEKGKVTLNIHRAPDGRLAFAVTDTGIGITEAQQRTIFEPFRQADGSISRKYGGTGLGLSISMELARLLGGEITLTSEHGKGSTFTVTLPDTYDGTRVRVRTRNTVQTTPDTFPPEKLTAPIPWTRSMEDDRDNLQGHNRVILAIEDDESFAKILYNLAHELDFKCLIATTAEEGLIVAKQYLPSAVILDVGLPDHSGLSVLDRLKRDIHTRHIPVHVVSATDYAQTALSLGAVGAMLKPIKREQLVEILKGLETRLSPHMRRVLIVEDDAVQRESMGKLLASDEVETVGVGTAAECLECLKDGSFDCMVLDLSLPDASGYSLLETLSKEEDYSFPPVIVYTGRDLSADEEQRLRRYSKSIIIKGAKSPERLLDEVTLFLHQVVAELPPEQQKMIQKARNRDAVLEGRRILVVEDDIRNVYSLTKILEPRGAIVQIARNGLEALDALDKAGKNAANRIDLVLMDVMMPEMDGMEATRNIRKRSEWKKLPVIMLTAKAMKDDQERCLDAGANDYMAKPLDVEKLLSLVRVWMPR